VIKTITDAQKRVTINQRGEMTVVPEQDAHCVRTKLQDKIITVDKKTAQNIICDTYSFGGS
jgi:hypothetical protein